WVGIFRKITAVRKNRSMGAVWRLIQDHDQTRRLNNPREVEKIVEGDTDGLASCEWAVLPVIAHPLQKKFFGPRLNVLGIEVLRNVEPIKRSGASPDSREVRFAVRRARGGRCKVRLAVRQARSARRRVVQPLRIGNRADQQRQDTCGE